MGREGRYPKELRERAVRMVFDHKDEHPSQWSAIISIATKFGVSSEALRKWVRRAEVDGGIRPGLTTDEREWLKSLEPAATVASSVWGHNRPLSAREH